MKAHRILTTGLLASAASAQLLVHPFTPQSKNNEKFIVGSLQRAAEQQTLNGHVTGSGPGQDIPPFKAGQFTVKEQNNSTCATYGEKQWTGTVDVTDERRLFFWFFESRNDPENDPVILWLNGGPGGSSMMGLFNEMGPCWIEPNATETVPNPWSWNNNASLLFIDQPAGVGLSTLKPGARLPNTDSDGAPDFQTLLNVFFGDIFPEKAHLPIHFAVESYGGHYGPMYLKHILDARSWDSSEAFWGNITSMILIDAVLDFAGYNVGVYELLCSDYRGQLLNDTACEGMRLALPECERLGESCQLMYDGMECLASAAYCERIHLPYFEQIDAGLRNPYNIGLGCPIGPPLCGDIRKGNFTDYINQKHIKGALGFPESFEFEAINFAVNLAYILGGSVYRPTTREMASILDAAPTGLGDVRLLVLNGNEDYVVNSPGQRWQYDRLHWSGQAEYRIAPWRDLADEDDLAAATGFWKASPDARLVFVGVDGAGHTVPGDVREGSWRIVQRWIEGGWHA